MGLNIQGEGWHFKYLFFWGVLHFRHTSSFSQSTVIDSLEKLLVNEKEDSSRIELLLQLSKNYDNVDTAKARNYHREADAIAIRSGNEVLLGFTNELAGIMQTGMNIKRPCSTTTCYGFIK